MAEGQSKTTVKELCFLHQQELYYTLSLSLISSALLFKHLVLPFTNRLFGVILFCSHEQQNLINVFETTTKLRTHPKTL